MIDVWIKLPKYSPILVYRLPSVNHANPLSKPALSLSKGSLVVNGVSLSLALAFVATYSSVPSVSIDSGLLKPSIPDRSATYLSESSASLLSTSIMSRSSCLKYAGIIHLATIPIASLRLPVDSKISPTIAQTPAIALILGQSTCSSSTVNTEFGFLYPELNTLIR